MDSNYVVIVLCQVIVLCILALPIACVSWTVTKEEIFKELRDWCKKLNGWQKGSRVKFVFCKLAYLPTCYYCFSHWVTLVFLLVFPVKLLVESWWGYVFALFATAFIANGYLTSYNILRSFLRYVSALADTAEARARREKEQGK